MDKKLEQLADAYGISKDFWDWKGHHRVTPEPTIIACLKAFDVDVMADQWMDAALAALDERLWRQALPPCTVVEQSQEVTIPVHTLTGDPINVWVRQENGDTFDLHPVEGSDSDRAIDGRLIHQVSYRSPNPLPLGYHTVFLQAGEITREASLVVTPSWLGLPQIGPGSSWGLMVQLYSIGSAASWGVGDFADLKDLAVWSKTRHNAQFVLINPTHAAEAIPPMEPSPYLPATRRFLNPIYIRPEMVEEYAFAAPAVRDQVGQIRTACHDRVFAEGMIDRDTVWAAKRAALDLIFQVERRPVRQMELDDFIAQGGADLRNYATWCVLCEAYGQHWQEWPDDYQDPGSDSVQAFVDQHRTGISFHLWLQWIAASQAKSAQRGAKDVGMSIGIIDDLAVGIDKYGEETWSCRDVFAPGISVGAPPDAYNQSGQDWSQPPWRPDKLEEASYAPFISMLRSILSESGGLRVDHIIGLFRLWWIPEGLGPDLGTYVRYNHEAMVGILALEAWRAQAAIVGEDLGTVEPWVRDYLARRGILGTSILWFENGSDGRPLNPEQWRELAMGSVTTHDLPPTLGYLAHDHVALRHRLGLLTESLDEEIAHDANEQSAVIQMLVARGLLPERESDPHEIMLALYRFLYQTRSKLQVVTLADAVGERRTQNQPGTIDEYPNWRVPLGDESGRRLDLEEIFGLESVERLADIMNGKV